MNFKFKNIYKLFFVSLSIFSSLNSAICYLAKIQNHLSSPATIYKLEHNNGRFSKEEIITLAPGDNIITGEDYCIALEDNQELIIAIQDQDKKIHIIPLDKTKFPYNPMKEIHIDAFDHIKYTNTSTKSISHYWCFMSEDPNFIEDYKRKNLEKYRKSIQAKKTTKKRKNPSNNPTNVSTTGEQIAPLVDENPYITPTLPTLLPIQASLAYDLSLLKRFKI